MVRYLVILFAMFWTFVPLEGQNQIGMRLENRAGIYGVSLNPSLSAYMPHNWELGLVAAGVFFETNRGYFSNTNILEILTSSPDLRFEHTNLTGNQFLSLDVIIHGPSMILRRGDFTFGLFVNSRVSGSSQNIPSALGYEEFTQQSFNESFTVDRLQGAAAFFIEYGGTISKRLSANLFNLYIGANAKFIRGLEGGYFSTNQMTITRLDEETVALNKSMVKLAFTDFNESGSYSLRKNGVGYGFDFGISFTDGGLDNYQWKFGASILDIGMIKFGKNANTHIYTSETDVVVNKQDVESEDYEEVAEIISTKFYDNPEQSAIANKFSIGLPMAISFQGDYSLFRNTFVSSIWVQRIGLSENTIQRDNLLSFMPRYESPLFSVSIPASLYNYRDIRFGLALRLAVLTIGSDNILGLFRNAQLSGTDFYIGLKINSFSLGSFSTSNTSKRKGRIKCYSF